jgi:outer membrane scaffolding protein for murein synthesis (MipA/OmpV family)
MHHGFQWNRKTSVAFRCRMTGMAFILLAGIFPATAFGNGPAATKNIKTVPLWEVQCFFAGFHLPHYRGSDESETYVAPVPYFEYRGEFLKIDQDGVKGIFFRSEHFETDLSAYGNPPVGDGNDARKGMEKLDPLVELGPSLKWHPLGRFPGMRFYAKATVRGVLSVDFPNSLKTHDQGIHGVLSLVHVDHALLDRDEWQSKITLGADWTDRDYNAYFYDVPERQALPDRPAYHAGGGYGGFFLSGHLIRILTDRVSISGYARWENCTGAAFEASPLVETQNNFSLGAMVIWTALRSNRLAEAGHGQ